MRNDPRKPGTDKNDAMGLVSVLTGYAALALVLMFIVVLLVAGYRHTPGPAKQAGATGTDTFGIEELVDLFTEPAVASPDFFVWQKPRPITRAELDLKQRR